jgi:hypothetical protein
MNFVLTNEDQSQSTNEPAHGVNNQSKLPSE